MVIEELNIKGATIRIHDDFIRSREESLEIMKRVEENAYRHLAVKYARKKEPEKPNKDGPA